MRHQAFWVTYLEQTGAKPTDWIYWLAYDDEIRKTGIDHIVDADGNWPLEHGTVYFGPWAMRHELPDDLWNGDPDAELENWTSFPMEGPTQLPVMNWIREQLRQPTYIQMSGSVCPFRNFLHLHNVRPPKTGPMRIEMATAVCRSTIRVAEFPEPVSIIYGRSNSDRSAHAGTARREDIHLLFLLVRYATSHPKSRLDLAKIMYAASSGRLRHFILPARTIQEEWRVRGHVSP